MSASQITVSKSFSKIFQNHRRSSVRIHNTHSVENALEWKWQKPALNQERATVASVFSSFSVGMCCCSDCYFIYSCTFTWNILFFASCFLLSPCCRRFRIVRHECEVCGALLGVHNPNAPTQPVGGQAVNADQAQDLEAENDNNANN